MNSEFLNPNSEIFLRGTRAQNRTTDAYERFAMKDGTANNLFVRDMPRLSAGIDPGPIIWTPAPLLSRQVYSTAIFSAIATSQVNVSRGPGLF